MLKLVRTNPSVTSAVSADKAHEIAVEAFLFGYPLVLMDLTRIVMTAATGAAREMKAPVNQFKHMDAFPDATLTDVVSPNADTLYSSAWIDVGREPIVLSVPDTGGRYYLMPILDAWTNVFASPGARTTGTGKGAFAICGPRWKGWLPDGVKELRAPTEMVWMIGRTKTDGKADYAAVNRLQAQYKLTPLRAWGRSYKAPPLPPLDPAIDTKTAPVNQVAAMDGVTFFNRLASLMAANPPVAADGPMVDDLAMLGVKAGEPFRPDASVVPAINAAVEIAFDTVVDAARGGAGGGLINGWTVNTNLGQYGTDYAMRSLIAWVGLGANLSADAVYPMTRVDADGRPLSGANKYVLHFDKSQVPPVNAFWSLTMYNDKQAFVANPMNRYAIGDRDALTWNADGSLDIYVQADSPGTSKESNWLPAPHERFNVILRLYWPKESVLNGSWTPQANRRAS
jgi:hypothetical protein